LADDILNLVHHEVSESDSLDWIGDVSLELSHANFDARRSLALQVDQGQHLRRDVLEEGAGICDRDRHGDTRLDEFAGSSARVATVCPEGGEDPRLVVREEAPERAIPLGRPAADDQPVVAEQGPKEVGEVIVVGVQFEERVAQVWRQTIPVHLHDQAVNGVDGRRGLILDPPMG
jgi:hypothetical protein